MCPMLLSSLRDGPAMVLSPPQEHAFLQFPRQAKLDATPGPGSRPFLANRVQPHSFSSGVNALPGTLTAPSSFPNARPSRKRSRDDVAVEDSLSNTIPVQPPVPKEEPIYGMALSAESQTGTWYEEAVENAMAAAPHASLRNHASEASRKSQRLNPSAPGLNDVTLSRIQRQLQGNDNDDNRRIPEASTRTNPFSSGEPLVDDATHLLGISWQRIQTDDADMAAAVRGWKRYIDRQFSRYLSGSDILMKNRALNAYLVTARPMTPLGPATISAFYLFNDDLTKAQLVGSSWENCVRNLQSTPIMFEGTEVLSASDKPSNSGTFQDQTVLGSASEAGQPLIQTLCAQPVNTTALNNGVGMGMGMDIDV